MTIDEAIKEIQDELDEHPACSELSYYKALKLGIEALKRIKEVRNSPLGYWEYRLPGETKE